jgi:uncharacterized membrane protein YkoI
MSMSKRALRAFVTALAISFSGTALADVELTFEELPEPVQKTAVAEVKAGKIVEIERDLEKGATVYEIEFVLDGIKYELDIAPDGTLLRRHRD